MKQQVVILHGSGSHGNAYWHKYIKDNLDSEIYEVCSPDLGDEGHPKLADRLETIKEKIIFEDDVIVIAHSSGCPLALHLIETKAIKARKTILVAGFYHGYTSEMLPKELNWETIKSQSNAFVFINSTNDPWGCDDKQGRYAFDRLGGTLIINNEGHMGSNAYEQPYKEFPLLLELIK